MLAPSRIPPRLVALLGWVALQLVPAAAALLLAAGFGLHLWADRSLAAWMPLPAWYLPLRLRLTAIVCLCLLAEAWRGAGTT